MCVCVCVCEYMVCCGHAEEHLIEVTWKRVQETVTVNKIIQLKKLNTRKEMVFTQIP